MTSQEMIQVNLDEFVLSAGPRLYQERISIDKGELYQAAPNQQQSERELTARLDLFSEIVELSKRGFVTQKQYGDLELKLGALAKALDGKNLLTSKVAIISPAISEDYYDDGEGREVLHDGSPA